MTPPGPDRPSLEELIASLRTIGAGQEVLVRELALLREEIRALRTELTAGAARPPAPAVAPVAPVEPPAPVAPIASPAPPAPAPARRRRWPNVRELLEQTVGALGRPLAERAWARLQGTWGLALMVGLLVAGASELNLLQPVEVLAEYPKEWARAGWSRRDVVGHIVAVAIDDESIAALGPWGPAWRAHHGRILRHLADDGARAAGFDVTFKTANEQYDPAFLDGIRHARAKGMGVVAGVEYDARQGRFSPTAPRVQGAVSQTASVYLEKDRVTNLVRYVTMFQEAAGADGHVRLVPALSVAVALAAGRRVEEFPRYRDGIIPIDFAGPSSTFQTVSYLAVHDRRFPPGTFAGKYVLVGAFFPASRDFFDTPVESEMPGVLIHGNALYTLLRGVSRPLGTPWKAGIILGVALVTGGICARFRRAPRAVLVGALVLGYWGTAIALGLTSTPLNLDVVPATASVILMWAAVTVREKVTAMRELGRTLGLPEEAVRRLEDDAAFQAGTLGKRVTVLASDVKNYSAFSRAHPPVHVRQIMSEYTQMVERVIYRHGGYVNKFIGDAVVAIFGYPMDEETTALRCVLAAKETQEGLHALTEKWRRERKAGIGEIRIGINTGVVSVSYLGSSKKQLDVMGANVDLAARLESAAGEFGCLALLGPETYEEVRNRIKSRTVPVQLKNRPDVTHAFTFDGLVDEQVPAAPARA